MLNTEKVTHEAWSELKRHYEQWWARHPPGPGRCGFDEPFSQGKISPGQPTVYILGFNAGEPKDTTREPSQTPSATNWVRRCSDVQMAAGTEGFISIERCYWGSPNVPELRKRVASRRELRGLLTSHAAANTALFVKYPPLLVWVPGVSTYHQEAIEDYELSQKEDERFEESKGRRNTVWRLHRNAQGVPFLFTWHPSARLSGDRWRLIQAKVTELASASRRRMKLV